MKRIIIIVFIVFFSFSLSSCRKTKESITQNIDTTTLESYKTVNVIIGTKKKVVEGRVDSLSLNGDSVNVTRLPDGVIAIGKKEGISTLTYTVNGKEEKIQINSVYEKITASFDDVRMKLDDRLDFEIFTSSFEDPVVVILDKTIAKYEDGVLIPLSQGSTTMRISSLGVVKDIPIRVIDVYKESIECEYKKDVLIKNESIELDTTIYSFSEEAYDMIPVVAPITYSSSDENVIKVTSDGILTAIGRGEADITISIDNGNIKKKIAFSVLEKIANSSFDIFNNDHLNWLGRVYRNTQSGIEGMRVDNTASGFELIFKGTKLESSIYSTCSITPNATRLKVTVDGVENVVVLDKNQTTSTYVLASNLTDEMHRIKVLKMTEDDFSKIQINSITTDGVFYGAPRRKGLKIEFYGDSITAGYGVLGKPGEQINAINEDGTSTYAYFLSEMLDAESSMICCQGISAACPKWQTFTMLERFGYASISSKKTYDPSNFIADIIVINLGTNDSSSSDQSGFESGYKKLVEEIHKVNPTAKIVCTIGLMAVNSKIRNTIEKIASELNYCYYVGLNVGTPGAAGHPSKESNEIAAETLYSFIVNEVLK